MDKAVLDVEIKDIALQLATLITPIDGIVTQIDTPVAGVNVITTDTFSVANPNSIVFSANVDETDVGKVILGQTAQIDLDAFPDQSFTGSVSSIAFAAETSSGGATVFPVEISFADMTNLRIGLNGDVTIILSEHPSLVTIPTTAIRETEEEEKYVVKKVGKKYEKTFVETGIDTEDDTEIKSGLSLGEQVVTDGFQYLPKNLQ